MLVDQDFELFFRQHENRIHFQIHRLGVSVRWYDDFYSEGIVALWDAYREFDEARGNLGTFINYKIRFRLIDLLRKKLRRQEVMEEAVEEARVSLETGNRHRSSGMPLIDSSGIYLEDDTFWRKVRKCLTERQWLWVQYFIIADLSVQEIMELEGVSADAVKGWGREVRRKLRHEPLWQWLETR
ncbi:MAG TPA: sigma-70 family RNA polymerase sigma factor [Pseudogracilibacillus sp.]|nr:sigma-70 family RNA polymerase sigma factor [Pseudogracilibacillus sp.]